jgi:2,5-diketo-D-gluconate reductase B
MRHVDAHGVEIPAMGFGTGSLKGRVCVEALGHAFRAGYRHLDTARTYGNEAEVGEAVRASGLKRDEIFLTTKVWPDRLGEAEMLRSAEESVAALGVEQVDLFLIHWPNPKVTVPDMIRALNEVKRRGLTRHIGVSNFTSGLLAEAWAATGAPLVVNQCEYHPSLDQGPVIDACRAHGTAFVAYMPLGRREVLNLPLLSEIGRRLGRTPAQIALRWLVQQDGVAAIPKSTDPSRLCSNIDVFDFSLSDDDMAAISALAHPGGRMVPFPRMRNTHGGWDEFRAFAPTWDS